MNPDRIERGIIVLMRDYEEQIKKYNAIEEPNEMEIQELAVLLTKMENLEQTIYWLRK